MQHSLAIVPDDYKEVSEVLQWAQCLSIRNDAENAAAAERLRAIKDLSAKISEYHEPEIKKAHELHKSMVARKKDTLQPLEQAEAIVKGKMATYYIEQERHRIEQQRIAEEQARKAEESRLLAEAAMLEEIGDECGAQEIMSEALTVQPPTISLPKAVKPTGISMRSVWTYEIVDAAAIPREYLVVDHPKLSKVVGAMKSTCRIPGIRVYEEKSISARR